MGGGGEGRLGLGWSLCKKHHRVSLAVNGPYPYGDTALALLPVFGFKNSCAFTLPTLS